MQPIWKTEGKSPMLSEHCLDVFVWSNLAFIQLFLSVGRGELNEKIEIESKKSYIEKTNNRFHLTPLNDLSDSIVVVFDNTRAIIQHCQGRPLIGSTPICGVIEDNLSDFNFGDYNSGKLFKGSSMTITFDDSDLERALYNPTKVYHRIA